MEHHEPNSHKYKKRISEEKKVQKVINGDAKLKKKNSARKLADVFVAEDVSNVKSHVISDIVVPAVKKIISDIVKDGIDMVLYGVTGQRKTYSDGFRAAYVDYNKVSVRRDDRRHPNNQIVNNTPSYDNIVLNDKGDAELVLSTMDDIIDSYGEVSVAALYELVGLKARYTDNNYGWINLGNAKVTRVIDGYLLDLPRAVPLKD